MAETHTYQKHSERGQQRSGDKTHHTKHELLKKQHLEQNEVRLPEKKVLSNNGSTFSGVVDVPARTFDHESSPKHHKDIKEHIKMKSPTAKQSSATGSTSQQKVLKYTPKKGKSPPLRVNSPKEVAKEFEELAARYERENEQLKQVIELNKRHDSKSPNQPVPLGSGSDSPVLRQRALDLERQRKELEARLSQMKTRLRLLKDSEEWELKTIEEFRAKKVSVIQHKLERLEAKERVHAERENLLLQK